MSSGVSRGGWSSGPARACWTSAAARAEAPALRLAESTGANVVGVDVLEEGVATATRLASERGLADRVRFVRVDAGSRLPFADESFDAVISVDVMCHLPNRLDTLRDWHRVTAPGALILFTDPTIVTGLVTDTEIADHSAIGIYVFSAESVNEALLARAGFEVSRREDLTENMAAMAGRWHDARAQFRDELLLDEGEATFAGIQRFLAASHVLARERRLSRLRLPRTTATRVGRLADGSRVSLEIGTRAVSDWHRRPRAGERSHVVRTHMSGGDRCHRSTSDR